MRRNTRGSLVRLIALFLAIGLVAAACGDDDDDTAAAGQGNGNGNGNGNTQEMTDVSVQLLWLEQAQFAGYFAADEQGYYEDEGLNVTVRPGGPDASVAQLVASGDANFGVLTLGQTLQARDQGIDLVNIAQIFTRSAYRLVSFADEGIETVEDLEGKRVGAWPGTLQLFAAFEKIGLDQDRDLTLVQQAFDMQAFLDGELDAASATTYNELAQVLKAGHTLDELNVLSFDDVGTFQLEDGIITSGRYLQENPDVAERFVRATLRGWIFCRDNPQDCVDITLQRAPDLDPALQAWMMNEVNKIIWPAPNGVGLMPEEGFDITADMLVTYGGIENPADEGEAVNREVWEKATADMDADLTGEDFEPLDLTAEDL